MLETWPTLVRIPTQDGIVRPAGVNQNGANDPHATSAVGQSHYSQLKQSLHWVTFVLFGLAIFLDFFFADNFVDLLLAFLEGTNNVLFLYKNVC